MTPRDRLLSAIHRRPVDRTAVGSATSVANLEQMDETGAAFPDVHPDGERKACLAAGAHTIPGYNAIMTCFSIVAEASALGCEVDWGDRESMPAVRTFSWEDPAQVVNPEDLLDRPPVRAVLDALRLLRAQYPDRVALIGKAMGPRTLACRLHGVQQYLLETLTDPEHVRAFLERLQGVTVLFGQAQLAAGADSFASPTTPPAI